MQMEMKTLIHAFTEILGCIENVYIWHYDSDFQYIESSCTDVAFWNAILQSNAAKTDILKHCHESTRPILFGDETELLWIAAPNHAIPGQVQSVLTDIYILGPVFLSLQSENKMRQNIRQHTVSIAFQQDLIRRMKKLPAISGAMFFFFGTMLHYCLTKERISSLEIPVHTSNALFISEPSDSEVSKTEIYSGAVYEELLLHLIEEGNLNYLSILDAFPLNYGHIGVLAQGDSVRQLKNQFIAAATLYSRAAIRGGLSRGISLTLSNQYIRTFESSMSIPEILNVYYHMLDDFICRVHVCKQQEISSVLIRNCIDIIEYHIQEPLNIKWIAEQVNYSDYYLSKLFKREMGISISDYVKQKKIDYAKILLLDTKKNIQDIAEELSFSTSSRFTEIFRKITGATPTEYRKNQINRGYHLQNDHHEMP